MNWLTPWYTQIIILKTPNTDIHIVVYPGNLMFSTQVAMTGFIQFNRIVACRWQSGGIMLSVMRERESPPTVACGMGSGEFMPKGIRSNHFLVAFILRKQLFSWYECNNNLTAYYFPISSKHENNCLHVMQNWFLIVSYQWLLCL